MATRHRGYTPRTTASVSMRGLSDDFPKIPSLATLILFYDPYDKKSYPGSGTTIYDLTKVTDGTLTNGVTVGTDYLEFDGDNDYVDLGTIGTSHKLQLDNPANGGLTVFTTLKNDKTGDSYQRIIDKSNGGNALNGWSIFEDDFTASGQYTMVQNNNTIAVGADTIPSTNWESWGFTHVKSSGAWAWYLNGASDGSGTATYSIPNSSTTMRLGTWNHSTGREYNGRMGVMLVFDSALTSSEISLLHDIFGARHGI